MVVNGKTVQTKGAPPNGLYHLSTEGEFGSDLIDLFTPPVRVEFKFLKQETISSGSAMVYGFTLPAEKNAFWTIRGGRDSNINPEIRGKLWLQSQSGRLLRLQIEPLHLPPQFIIAAAKTVTDYDDVSLGDAGVFLLPTSSETSACIRRRDFNTNLVCVHNAMSFHNCRKFAPKARILGEPDSH